MTISTKKLSTTFTGLGMAGALLSGCTTLEKAQIDSPLPSYKSTNATDISDPLCTIVKSKNFNPGWFLLVKFQTSNTTQMDQECLSRKFAEVMADSNDPYFQTIAVEFYDRTTPAERTRMDEYLALQNKTIDDVRANSPRLVGSQEVNGCPVVQYRMPGQSDRDPPAVIIRCGGVKPVSHPKP